MYDYKKKPKASVQSALPIYRPVQRQAALEIPEYELEPAPTAPVAATPTAAPLVPFTLTNSRSVAPSVQRAVAAPALTAGRLLAADQSAAQEAEGEVKVSRIQLSVSGATLAERGLPVETAATLQRQAPPSAPAPPPTLSPVQRQLVTETAGHDVTASFTRDARYVPGAVRAEMALGAIQRAVKQGADGAALHARLEGLATTPQDQAAVQRAVSLQRQQEERAAQAREGYALQVEHVRLQRQLAEAVQRHEEANVGTVLQRVQARQGGGEPLPVAVQRHLEAGLNADLSRVRVHHDAEADGLARSVGAKAFTTGADIYFRRGLYDPTTPEGLALTAHEATHTVQQAQGKVGPGVDPDAGLEAEAQRIGETLGRAPLNAAPAPRTPTTSEAGRAGLAAASLQRKAAPTATDDATVRAALEYARTHPSALAQALSTGVFMYYDPAPTRPPRPFPLAQLKSVFDHLDGPALLAVRNALLARSGGKEFYVTLARAFGGNYALAVQKRIGAQRELSPVQLTLHAFVEQLTIRGSYMNDLDLGALKDDRDAEDANHNGSTQEKESNFQGQKLLAFFGYRNLPPVLGQWGFQMRVFVPIPLNEIKDPAVRARRALFNQPIVVFRGTEGLQLTTKEGGVDTLVGDAAQASVGMNQVRANAELIRLTLGQVKSAIFAGHSLGGGLAQIVAAQNAGKVAQVITFQSPGIPAELAKSFAATNRSQATHYRMAGDIVPNAGEQPLPGTIEYFTRFQKDKGAAQYRPVVDLAASHKSFPLTTLLQGVDPAALSPEQRAILAYGAHDGQEIEKGAQARLTHTGTFETTKDPRVNLEGARSTVGPVLLGDAGYMAEMAEANIGYNTLLEAAQARLKTVKTYEQFKAVYQWLETVKELPLSKQQEQMVERLGVRNSTPIAYPIKVNSKLIDQVNIPLPGVMGNPTFINEIRANGGMVKIERADITRARENLHIHWENLHPGTKVPLDWVRRVRGELR